MRKSCSANCKLKHAFDTNGDLHLLVAASANITKGTELTLPFDLCLEMTGGAEKVINTEINLNNCVCNCQKEKCVLRSAINQMSDHKICTKKTASGSSISAPSPSKKTTYKTKKLIRDQQQASTESEANLPNNNDINNNRCEKVKEAASLKEDTKNTGIVNEEVEIKDTKKKASGVSKRQSQPQPVHEEHLVIYFLNFYIPRP